MAVGSIVDYLKSVGKDSSYSARKNMANEYGIQNYRGTAGQNTSLLRYLNQGKDTKQNQSISGRNGSENTGAGTIPGNKSQYLSGYKYQKYSPSNQVNKYNEKLSALEGNRPDEFDSRYEGQIDDILNSILDRPKFDENSVYDSDLYKNYRENYIQQGQRAMRDVTGNMAGLTGGYGSSYAVAAGQQAYDNYLGQLNEKSLDIYDRLYNKYLNEGQELYNQLGTLNNQDNIDYGRYRDTVSDYQWDLGYYNNRYNQEYNNDFNSYQSDLTAQQWAEQYAYQKSQDALAQQNWQAQFDYQKQQDAVANSYKSQKAYSSKDPETQKVTKMTDGEAQNYLYNVFKDTKKVSSAAKEAQNLLKEGYIDESQMNAMKYALSMMGRK